ncbi:MAG: lysozyme [Phormidesmis sp. RL_2_1]|nr:lysozyme [Phormidesmis sp. RL_2_1]
MGTWIKETAAAFYLMDGGHYISKISKYPSQSNPAEQVVNITGMKAWFSREDAPRGMTISTQGGPEPQPKPEAIAPVVTPPSSSVGPKRTNANGLLLIKSFEGLRLQAYRDAVGIWTIGYGTTRGVRAGQRISEAEAEKFLQEDLLRFEKAIHEAVTVPVNDNQFSALVSFTYNVGSGAFRSSTLLQMLNKRQDVRAVGDQFPRWNRAGGRVLDGLTRRRKAERALFLGEDFYEFL